MTSMVGFQASHFIWRVDGTVAVIQLNRPERKNPLTFDSYAELRDMFRKLPYADDIHAVVFLPNGGNFCSGGDVQEIIGPLVAMDVKQLLAFTRMTGDLVKAMLHCGKPIIAAVDGTAAGAGASSPWLPICVSPRRRRKLRFCSIASGLPVATWVPAGYCPASSARAALPSSCSPVAP